MRHPDWNTRVADLSAAEPKYCVRLRLVGCVMALLVPTTTVAAPVAAGTAAAAAASGPQQAEAIRFVFAGAFSGADPRVRYWRLVSTLTASFGRAAALVEEPSSRALLSMATGTQQADVSRVPNFHEKVPGAVRLEPHVVQVHCHALVRAGAQPPQNWAQLSERSVAYMRGIQGIIDQLPARVQHHPVTTRVACVQLLALGRVDVCILHLSGGAQWPSMVGEMQVQTRVLSSWPLYLWVGPGQPELAQRLQTALTAWTAAETLPPSWGRSVEA